MASLLVIVWSQGSGTHRHLGEGVENYRVLTGLPGSDAVGLEQQCNTTLRLSPSGGGQGVVKCSGLAREEPRARWYALQTACGIRW